MSAEYLAVYDESLRRCNAKPGFLDRFYEKFLASSPTVKEKFAKTDFVQQKRALRASLFILSVAAGDEDLSPGKYLRDIASSHSKRHLDIGSALYDLWLDSLLETVKEFDPESSPEVVDAWEKVMTVGIEYLVSHYHEPPEQAYKP